MMNHKSGFGKAKEHQRNNLQPISGTKDFITRQYYRKAREPEFLSLLESEHNSLFPTYTARRTSVPQYKDTEDTDPDNLLHCPECGAKWGGKCPLHGVLHFVTDVTVPRHSGNTLRADLTTPYVVNISALPTGETGVTARMPIPIRTRFGPYEGEIVSLEEASEHAWLIRRDGKPDHCVDARDPGLSNWMRYIQNAPRKGDENLLAYQYQGELYYMTLRNIYPGDKLSVWCGSRYKQPDDTVPDTGKITRGVKIEGEDDTLKDDQPSSVIGNPTDQCSTDSATRYIKQEVEDVDNGLQDRQDSRMISRGTNALNHDSVVVKQELQDDSYCEASKGECRKEGSRREHASENVIIDIEDVRRKIKLEVVEDCETPFIKEEVECNQSDLSDEVSRCAADVLAGVEKASDEDLMDLGRADLMEGDSGNETVASEEGSSTNGYNAVCSSRPADVPGAVADIDDLKDDKPTGDPVLPQMCSEPQPRKKILSCSDCKKFFGSNFALDRHVQMHHRSEPLETGTTIEDPEGEKTESSTVKNSSQSCSGAKPQSRLVSCCDCKKIFEGNFALYCHIKMYHRSKSSQAGDHLGERTESFAGKVSSQSRSEVKPKSRIVSCRECNRFFEGNIALDRHLLMHNRSKSLKTVLSIRKKTEYYADKSPSEMGFESQPKTKIVSCSDCKKFFEGEVALDRHLQLCHRSKPLETAAIENIQDENIASSNAGDSSQTRSEVPTVIKAVTSKSFASNFALSRHLKKHHGSKPFYCGVCKVAFDCKSELVEHRLKDKRHGCHERSNQLLFEGNYRNFRGKVAPFFCPQRDCFLRFTTRRGYQKHLLKHKSQMTVKCPKCLKELGSQANLNVHLKRTICSYLPYICSKCKTAFVDHAALEDHACPARTLDNENVPSLGGSEKQQIKRPYRCSDCNLPYDSRRELHEHFRISHKPQSSIFCVYCKKMYSDYHVLRRHVRRVHSKERSYVCKICNKEFFAGADLQRHSVIHSSEKTYTCIICVKYFHSKIELSKHLRVHKKELSCRLCYRQCSSYVALKQHIHQKHSGEMIFECLECKEKFPYHSDLEEHLEFHVREKLAHQAPDVPVVKECHKTLTLLENVQSDLAKKRKDYLCTDCERAFSDEHALFTHVCTLQSQEERFKCNKCGEKLNTSKDLERHLSYHQEERPNLCVECNSDFSCQSLLDEHPCIHNNERPFACSECDRRFWSIAAYKTHLHTHGVDRPHVCSECAESFSHPEQLKAHVSTHGKGATFICLQCDPGLNEKCRLNRPLATQYDEVNANLTCSQCDKTVSYDGLSEQASQDHRPFEFVSCEPD